MNIVPLSILGISFTVGVLFTTLKVYDKNQVSSQQVVEKSRDTLEVSNNDILQGSAVKNHEIFLFQE